MWFYVVSRFGGIIKSTCSASSASWRLPGSPGGLLGASWGSSGGPPWPPGVLLGASWGLLAASLDLLRRSWSLVGLMLGFLNPIWALRGINFGPAEAHFGFPGDQNRQKSFNRFEVAPKWFQELRKSRFSFGVVAFFENPNFALLFSERSLIWRPGAPLGLPGGAPGRRREVEVDQLFAPRRSQASSPSAVRCASGTGFAHLRWLGGRFGRERAYWIIPKNSVSGICLAFTMSSVPLEFI